MFALSLLSFHFTPLVTNCTAASTELQIAAFLWGTLLHNPSGFCSCRWWKADFVIQIISFESSHLPEVIIRLLASSFKTPSATMLTNCSWRALVQKGGDVLWHLLFASTPFILLLQLLTHPQPCLFAFCPPAIRALLSPGIRQLHNCTSLLRGQAFPQTENWQPQIFLNYGFWIAFFALTEQKQSRILSKSTAQDKWKTKWKYITETKYHHVCLSVQGRKREMKMTDICCIVQCTTCTCWDDTKMSLMTVEQTRGEQNSSTNSQGQAITETHPC